MTLRINETHYIFTIIEAWSKFRLKYLATKKLTLKVTKYYVLLSVYCREMREGMDSLCEMILWVSELIVASEFLYLTIHVTAR